MFCTFRQKILFFSTSVSFVLEGLNVLKAPQCFRDIFFHFFVFYLIKHFSFSLANKMALACASTSKALPGQHLIANNFTYKWCIKNFFLSKDSWGEALYY